MRSNSAWTSSASVGPACTHGADLTMAVRCWCVWKSLPPGHQQSHSPCLCVPSRRIAQRFAGRDDRPPRPCKPSLMPALPATWAARRFLHGQQRRMRQHRHHAALHAEASRASFHIQPFVPAHKPVRPPQESGRRPPVPLRTQPALLHHAPERYAPVRRCPADATAVSSRGYPNLVQPCQQPIHLCARSSRASASSVQRPPKGLCALRPAP